MRHLDALVYEKMHAINHCMILNKITSDISNVNINDFIMSESQRQSINRSKIY